MNGATTPFPHSYSQLPPKTGNEHFIRVLDVLPAPNRETPLECIIRDAKIVDGAVDKPYEALSYVWGDDLSYDSVICGKSQLSISKNLSHVLRRLRKDDQLRTLWVDAICINQNDPKEKEVQVGSMHQVYVSAQQVIIFMGEASNHDPGWRPESAFRVAAKFVRAEENELRRGTAFVFTSRGLVAPRQRKAIRRRNRLPYLRDREFTALRSFFASPWFSRMWVVQEAVCATKATIVSGEHEMLWSDFMKGTYFGLTTGLFVPTNTRLLDYTQKRVLPDFVSDAAPRANLSTAVQVYRLGLLSQSLPTSKEAQTMDLFHLLRQFHGLCAKDPRDKIFALVGMASLPFMSALLGDLNRFNIQVDYHTEASVLFRRLAQLILQSSQSLDLLSIPSSLAGGPSWVPDWSALSLQAKSLSYSPLPNYRSAGDSQSHPQFEESVLVINGIRVDRITRILDRSNVEPMTPMMRSYLKVTNSQAREYLELVGLYCHAWTEIQKWESLAPSGPNRTYITGEQYYDVYLAMLQASRAQFEVGWYGTGPPTFENWFASTLRQLCIKFRRVGWVARNGFLLSQGLSLSSRSAIDADIIRIRTFAQTEQGYLALVPADAKVGDLITICQGSKMPLVLRKDTSEEMSLIGDAYVHGMMNGEKYRKEDCRPLRIK